MTDRILRSALRVAATLAATCLLATGAHAQKLDVHYDGDLDRSNFGYAVASGFDLDGDGAADVAIGIPDEDANGVSDVGVVRIFSGRTHALLREIDDPLVLGATGSGFGAAVALVGDLDGDGVADVVVGAPYCSSLLHAHEGCVFAFSGATGAGLWSCEGQDGEYFGFALAAAGDVDQDGQPDLIVGAPGRDVANLLDASGALTRTWNGPQQYSSFGCAVAGGVDVDGDGVPDVVIGACLYTPPRTLHATDRGRVEVYSGPTSALIWGRTGPHEFDQLGTSVALLGDVNGDGKSEVLAGAFANGGGWVREFDGTGSTLSDFTGLAPQGYSPVVAPVGDLDGDGAPDFAVSGNQFVELHSGRDGHLFTTLLPIDGNAIFFGYALAAGDVDGDGVLDLVVGDPHRKTGMSVFDGGVDVFVTRPAGWRNYGSGWPGTNGVPALLGVGAPGLGESFSVQVGDSAAASTFGLLFLGFAPANLATPKGGSLLVNATATYPLVVPLAGLTMNATIPNDPTLLGVPLFLQVIETDSGASKGISFSAGLELDFGIDY